MDFSDRSHPVIDTHDSTGVKRNNVLLRAAVRYAEALRMNKAFGI